MELISIIDYTAATIVIVCLFLKFKNRWLWFIYGLGCCVYVFLNFNSGLQGQAVLNIVGGSIAFWNCITFNKKMK